MRPAPSGAVLLFRVAFSSVVVFGRAQPMRGRASGQWSVRPWPAQISARAFSSAIAFYFASHAAPRRRGPRQTGFAAVTISQESVATRSNCESM